MSNNSSDANPDPAAAPAAPTPANFAALPHNHQGPKLIATIWCLTGLAAVFLSLRIYCKFLRHKGLWWDDYILMAAWVSSYQTTTYPTRPAGGTRPRAEFQITDGAVGLSYDRDESIDAIDNLWLWSACLGFRYA